MTTADKVSFLSFPLKDTKVRASAIDAGREFQTRIIHRKRRKNNFKLFVLARMHLNFSKWLVLVLEAPAVKYWSGVMWTRLLTIVKAIVSLLLVQLHSSVSHLRWSMMVVTMFS